MATTETKDEPVKEISRGYVKWTDENGFHKEPLYDHPDLLASASPEDQLAAEEARRLNQAAEQTLEARDADAEVETTEVLEALKAAPDDVLTAAQLVEADVDGDGKTEFVEASAVEAPISSTDTFDNLDAKATMSTAPDTTTNTAPKADTRKWVNTEDAPE